MQCNQCGRPAMYLVGDDAKVPLCLDCHSKMVQTIALQSDMRERFMNFLAAHGEVIAGVPGAVPRFPLRNVVQYGDITLNNIKVDRSNIGVVNTGTIGTLDVAITALNQAGDKKLADVLKSLTEQVIVSAELEPRAKNEVLEILSFLATEATAPRDRRRPAVIRPALSEVSTLLQGASALTELWNRYAPMVTAFFS